MKEDFFRLLEVEIESQKQKEFQIIDLGPVEIEPKRNAFLDWVYSAGIVEASRYSAHCADKLFFAQMLQQYAPEAAKYHPITMGFSWFPSALQELKIELHKYFPQGFVVKKAANFDSAKDDVYLDSERFFADYEKSPIAFLSTVPVMAESTGIVSSGEKYLVQEKLQGFIELRLHSIEQRVVREATFTRWNEDWNRDLFLRAENSLQEFLSSLPFYLTRAQAWSFDLLAQEGVEPTFRIVEVNTNRGRKKQWSGDMIVPETLGAYVRHLEQYYGARFLGESGEAFRQNLANREKFKQRMGEDEFATHERLKLAYKLRG